MMQSPGKLAFAILLFALSAAPVRGQTLQVGVDLGAGPWELAGDAAGVTLTPHPASWPTENGGIAQIMIGEDGLPLLVLEVPVSPAAQSIAAQVAASTAAPPIPLAGPLLIPAMEASGEGSPQARPARPAAPARVPAVLAAKLSRARDRATAQVVARVAGFDGTHLLPLSRLTIEVTVDLGRDPRADHRSEPDLEARFARAHGDLAVTSAAPPLRVDPVFAPALEPTLDGSPIEVVIVTSEALRPEFERLAHYRTSFGHRAVVRTVEWIESEYAGAPHSDLAARIRAFIADARARWGTMWVLLGGDTDIIPARYAVSRYFVSDYELIPADLYYAALDGDWNADGDALIGEAPGGEGDPGDDVDLVPDVFLGRAPVSTAAEARQFVERQISYEEGAGAAEDYPASVLFLAEVLFESLDGAEIAEDTRQHLPPDVSATRLYENTAAYPGSEPETPASVLAALEHGYGVVEHVGHGFRNTLSVGPGSINNADIDGLGNRPRLPVFVALNCTSAAIDFNSIGERLVKNPAGGAIAYVGSSRYAFPGHARLYQEAFFRSAFTDSLRTVGEVLQRTRSLLAPLAVIEGAHRWTQFALTVVGDPMTPLFTRRPEPLVLHHDPSIAPGTETMAIQVTAGGAPIADAPVALLGADGSLATAGTDAAGLVMLPVPVGARGPFMVAASFPDRWPSRSGLAVVGNGGSYLVVRDLTVDDRADGDGDGSAEPGETVGLGITVENAGGEVSSAGEARIALSSGPGAMIDGQAALPSLAPGASAAIGSFSLAVDRGAADGDILALEIIIEAGPERRSVRRVLAVGGPRLRLAGHVIDGNGEVDPNETVRYSLLLTNDGGGPARAVTAAARVLDIATGEPAAGVTLLDGRSRFGDLRPEETTAGDPFVFALGSAVDPDSLHLEVRVTTALGAEPARLLDFVPPGPPTALRTRGSERAVLVSWTAPPDSDLAGYEVERAEDGGGPFVLVTPRPVAQSSFTDRALPELATLTYRVAAVDSSGNRSVVSATVEGTTNPGLHPGWPVVMGSETPSSPVLADLDGDGADEIVTGADALYAWHGDATELRNGDNDVLTSGVFTTDGIVAGSRGFHAVPAIADLDGDGELDLIGVAWEAAQVFAWRTDGSLLPGWPQSLGRAPNWGSAAVGDLDGDSDLEVTVLGGGDGQVYAWHHDGSEVADGDGNPETHGVLLSTGDRFSFGTPALADLDGNPGLEIVIGIDIYPFTGGVGGLHALTATGAEVPGFPRFLGSKISASPAIGDLDGDGTLEIVIAVEDDSLRVLEADGSPRPGWPQWAFIRNAPARTSSPVLADLDGDGRLEIVFAENSGAASHVAHLRVFRDDGSVFPGFENVTFATDPEAVNAGATQSTPVIGDVDGDTRFEILLGAEDGRLYGWHDDGSVAGGFPIQTEGEIRGAAALGDVDGDGLLELVVAGWDKNLYVWDLAGEALPDRVPWPFFHRDVRNSGNVTLPMPRATEGGSRDLDPDAAFHRGPQLFAPEPTPANPATEIRFLLPEGGPTRVVLYGVDGRAVRRLHAGPLARGEHRMRWDGRTDSGAPAPSGVYWIHLAAPGGEATTRIVVIR